MPVGWFLALKFLREYRAQTVLTVTAVGVGVAVMVFLSALIDGLQASLIARTLATQPHITVRPLEERARPQLVGKSDRVALRRIERPAQRIHSIAQWQKVDEELRRDPEVVATSPAATGDAFARRANASRPMVLLGIDPERFDAVIAVRDNLVRGHYRLEGREALIGVELADDLGLGVGDQVRVQTPEGGDALLRVRGIFDLGNRQVNQRWVLTSLRSAQALLDLSGGANVLHVAVRRVFDAERVAERVAARTGLVAESWMAQNEQLLIGLRSQSSSSYTIQAFVFIAVAMGIASVLVVSVVQRTREIGILRAMGIRRGVIAQVFVVQGALVGLTGSVVGCVLGGALSLLFARLNPNPDGTATFPMALEPQLFVIATALATATGVLAALLPARRAAQLDPVEAIRHA